MKREKKQSYNFEHSDLGSIEWQVSHSFELDKAIMRIGMAWIGRLAHETFPVTSICKSDGNGQCTWLSHFVLDCLICTVCVRTLRRIGNAKGAFFGIALNFLSEEGRYEEGIGFTARTVLRIGAALLGFRISFGMVAELGWSISALVIDGTVLTIAFGMGIARFFGHGPRFAVLSGGAVAICGASAAMAISAILPKDERSEERLVFTVVSVTLLSTIAMILFPVFADILGFSTLAAGVFIGAIFHDVAQVVGAGFSISDETGEIAVSPQLYFSSQKHFSLPFSS